MQKERAALRNSLILGGTLAGVLIVLVLIVMNLTA